METKIHGEEASFPEPGLASLPSSPSTVGTLAPMERRGPGTVLAVGRGSIPTHTSHTQPGHTTYMGIKFSLQEQLLTVPNPSLPAHQHSCSQQSLLEAPKSFLFCIAGSADPALLSITQLVISLLTITLILTSCSKPLRYKMNNTKSPLIPITVANAESKMLKQSLIATTWEFCLPRASKWNWC